MKNNLLKKQFYPFSALIMFLFTVTGCTTTEYTIPNNPTEVVKEQNQVIISNSTKEKTLQPEVPKQEPSSQIGETKTETVKESEKTESKKTESEIAKWSPSFEKEKNIKPSSFLGWGESNNQYWTNLQTVAKAASSFYQEKGEIQTLLSKEGKLYNSSTASYTTLDFLYQNGYLTQPFSDFDCDILLLKSSDILPYIDAQLSSSIKEVDIFTATKQPSGSKIMLCSAEGKITSLSEEEYHQLLNQYTTYHGKISQLSPQMEEYQRILNFIRVYEGSYDQYYVRDIRADNQYAVVTFSSQSTPNNVKQYVLINEDGFWEVAMNDLDKKSNLQYAVNHVLPDFNLSLLPPYNLSFYKNDMKADFSDVLKHMITNELIQQQSQVQYKCGTTNYCYMVLYGGERYIGKKIKDTWDIWKVKSAEDAIAAMRLDNQNAPTFIVLDE